MTRKINIRFMTILHINFFVFVFYVTAKHGTEHGEKKTAKGGSEIE